MSNPYHCNSETDLFNYLGKCYNKNIIFMFTAKWCGPCKYMKKTIEDIFINKYPGTEFIYLDVDEPELGNLVNLMNIDSMPTFILNRIVDNRLSLVDRFSGADIDRLENMCRFNM
jgi:thiol-disulfide isomerase/thioredoxin